MVAVAVTPCYMGRRRSEIKPRKVLVNGLTRFEVRVPIELQKQEGKARAYFETNAVAQGFCNRLKSSLLNYSDKARGLSDAQKIEAQEAYEMLSAVPGARLLDAVRRYLDHLAIEQRSVTVEDLGNRLVSERESIGGRGSADKTLIEFRSRWGAFARAFPGRLASTITPEEINDWLLGLDVELPTRKGYRRVLHTVFAYAAARVRRWVEVNPVTDVELPSIKRSRVSLLSPAETAQLLAAAVPEMRPYFAICAFAGARPNQAANIRWEQIHLDRMEIEIPAGMDKTDRERIVPIQPNLAAWLEQVPVQKRVGRIFYTRAWFELATKDAQIGAWEQDVLRHGYCSYRLKITGSFGTVADEAGNSEKVIRDRYYRSVSRSTAEDYFALMPPALPAGYEHQTDLHRWSRGPALAARVLPAQK